MNTLKTIGTETVEIKCRRCGGAGSREEWRNTGRTCFDCGGQGTEVVTRAVYADIIVDEKRAALNVIDHAIEREVEYALDGALVTAAMHDEDPDYSTAIVIPGGRGITQVADLCRDFVAEFGDRDALRAMLKRTYARDWSGTHGSVASRVCREVVQAVCKAGAK